MHGALSRCLRNLQEEQQMSTVCCPPWTSTLPHWLLCRVTSHLIGPTARQATLPRWVTCNYRPLGATAQPFLALLEGPHMEALSSILPLQPINKAAATAAAVSGRPLYPFRLLVQEFNKSGTHAPWVIYHVPTGTVYLDQQLVENVQQLPYSMSGFVKEFAELMFDHLLSPSSAASNQTFDASGLGQTFGTAAAAATSLTLASQVPLWFCIGCPIVLGMLFPFAFNFGLGAIADELCTHYNLPADECTQLWYSAFALAMILSFVSVIPIVSICRLAQCARSSPASSL
ncbi:hypothetical protein ABBQ32_003162 [Trebouxia sp. C0010 RCD-2024]